MQNMDPILLIMFVAIAGPAAIRLAALGLSPTLRKAQIARWRSDETMRILRTRTPDGNGTTPLGSRAQRQRTRAADQLARASRMRASAR